MLPICPFLSNLLKWLRSEQRGRAAGRERSITMPMITVQVATQSPSPALTRRIAATIAELTASILHKDPRVTAVAVEYVDPARWFVAGASAAELDQAAFFVDVRISDGTNTKDEKAEYI